MQRRTGALVHHPEPGDQGSGGQPLLVGRIDLPDIVWLLGPMPGFDPGPPGRGRSQTMPVQPASQRPVGGDLGGGGDAGQFDSDSPAPPVGMEAAEVQDRLQQRRSWRGTASAAISGTQVTGGAIACLRPVGAASQIADRADGQVESPGDLRRRSPEAGHPSNGQSEREVGGARHGNRLHGPGIRRIPALYRRSIMHETSVSGFRTKPRVR